LIISNLQRQLDLVKSSQSTKMLQYWSVLLDSIVGGDLQGKEIALY
jgi:hypothetical protein